MLNCILLAFFCWKDNWNIFVLLRSSLYLTKCAAQVVIFGQFSYDQCCHQINLNLSSNFCIVSESSEPGFPLLEVSYPWHFPILISETRSATSILPWNLLSQVPQMGLKKFIFKRYFATDLFLRISKIVDRFGVFQLESRVKRLRWLHFSS